MELFASGAGTINTTTMEGNWMQLKGKVHEQWGKLTNDELDVIAGKRDPLIGKIKEHYGRTTEAIEKEVTEFESRHAKQLTNHGIGAKK